MKIGPRHIIIDVRSPSEYNHAHIPGAINVPLFTDEERVVVGTTYKQISREDAIKVGLDYFGPKMRAMVENVEATCNADPDNTKEILVHCWRGGMRSAAVAWLLDLYGFKVQILQGGYKSFRNWVLQQFEREYSFYVLGGNTGSGKTYILHHLKKAGQKVIDLEGMAHHKGSAFGHIGLPEQPSQEMFENMLAIELSQCALSGSCIWIEDESQRIGHVNVPVALWKTMNNSPIYFVEVPFDERLDFIVKEYGSLDKNKLIEAITRIQKRLGGLEMKNAIQYLMEDNTKESFRILLNYYDKFYFKGLHKRNNLAELMSSIACETVDAIANARKIMALMEHQTVQTKMEA